jgi:hypothetical protein
MSAHHLVMHALFLAALVVGWLMLPGDAERIAMLVRDGRNGEALALLEARLDAGDRSQHTLHELVGLYEGFGDVAKARRTLELMVAQRPRDRALARRLQQLYRDTGDQEALTAALQVSIDQRYTEAACKELIGLLRRQGAFAQEAQAIQTCRNKGYRGSEDLVRLAALLAVDGDLTQASLLLRGLDDRRRLSDHGARLELLALLLQSELSREVTWRAVRWLRADKQERLAVAVVELLAGHGRHDLAIDIVRDASRPGDALSLSIAELMIDQGQVQPAAAYLRGWLERAHDVEATTAGRFVRAALDAEDAATAYRGAERFGLERLAQAELAALAEALGAVGLDAAFERVRSALAVETLGAHPLLVAAAAFNSGTTGRTVQLLGDVVPDRLESWRLALWARLMRETGQSAPADEALARLGAAALPKLDRGPRRETAALHDHRARSIVKSRRRIARGARPGLKTVAQRPMRPRPAVRPPPQKVSKLEDDGS